MPAIFTSRNTRSGRCLLYSPMPSTAFATARTSYPSNSKSCPSAARMPCSSSMIRMRRAMLLHVLVQGDLPVAYPNVADIGGDSQRQRIVGQSLGAIPLVDLAEETRNHSLRQRDTTNLRRLH